MTLSIILVNYKSTQLVLDCIESIYQQTSVHSFEIILVYNDSKDDCKLSVLEKYPAFLFLAMDYYAGFACTNNAGFAKATGDFITMLNSNTIILAGGIDKSIHLLQQNKTKVGAGVQLLNSNGTRQISDAQLIKGGLNTLLPLPYPSRLIRWLGYRFKSTIPGVKTIADDIEVNWFAGAYMLIKKEVFPKKGILEIDFFMYAEEIKWCSQWRKQGQLLLFAKPKLAHIGGGSCIDYYSTTENENGKNLWDIKCRQIIASIMLRIRKQFVIFLVPRDKWHLYPGGPGF